MTATLLMDLEGYKCHRVTFLFKYHEGHTEGKRDLDEVVLAAS